MRATITAVTAAALLAGGAASAAARPADTPQLHPAGVPSTAVEADAMRGIHVDGLRYQAEAAWYRHHGHVAPARRSALPRQDLRSPDARDAAAGRGMGKGPEVVVVGQSHPQPVHVTRIADGGFEWADAGIGAALAASLLLSAAGVSSLRRQHAVAR